MATTANGAGGHFQKQKLPNKKIFSRTNFCKILFSILMISQKDNYFLLVFSKQQHTVEDGMRTISAVLSSKIFEKVNCCKPGTFKTV